MPAKKTPIRASTQEHLPFKAIQENLVILKDGSSCLILKTTAINFGLLSEKEQEATIFAYAGLLNSLAFPIQIIVHSRQKDVSSYLSLIDQELKKQKTEKLKSQLEKYYQFIEKTVKKNKILDKSFYVVIPFISVQLKKSSQKKLLEKTKIDLYPKRDHLIGQLQRLGLNARQLNNQELIKLFYYIYNPQSLGQKFIPAKDYSSPFVQPLVKPAVLPPQLPTQQIQTQPVVQVSPSQAPNPMIPKQEIKKAPLEGEKLQEKINSIVAKTAKQQG